MEKLFPTGNQMIDLRIRYANEPGFTHAYFLLIRQRTGFMKHRQKMRETRFICISDSGIYHLFTFVRKYIFPYKF